MKRGQVDNLRAVERQLCELHAFERCQVGHRRIAESTLVKGIPIKGVRSFT